MEDWDGIARSIGYENEQAMLSEMYEREELSLNEIAKRLKKGVNTIALRLAACKIDRRARGGANNTISVTKKLFRMDQRLVFNLDNQALATLLDIHQSTVYKYRRGVTSRRKKTWSSVQSPQLPVSNDTEQH